jgi:hypothetical protein
MFPTLAKAFKSLDISKAKKILFSKYKYSPGKPGRPPNNPAGMVLAMILMLVKNNSTRDMEAFLRRDKFWRSYWDLNVMSQSILLSLIS